MTWAAVAVGAISIGASLFGAKKEGKAQKKIAEAEATIHEFNAQMNELESASTLRNSADIQIIMGKEAETALAKITTEFASKGISGSSVTAFEVKLEAARIYAENTDRFRMDAENRALKFRRLATLDRRKAEVTRKGGHFAAEAAWSRGVGEAVQTGGQTYLTAFT